jgi:hypothetical protein
VLYLPHPYRAIQMTPEGERHLNGPNVKIQYYEFLGICRLLYPTC